MKIYLYLPDHSNESLFPDRNSIIHILNHVAGETDTTDLVVSVYHFQKSPGHRGTAYVQRWMHPADFATGRGKWAFTRQWPIPPDLPERFKLIRVLISGTGGNYPKSEMDIYGWLFRYQSMQDHLALLFAHELHHFRRHHLGFHPREGEHGANRWALDHVLKHGYSIEGYRRKSRRTRRFPITGILKKFPSADPFPGFRSLEPGAIVHIIHDPKGRYTGQDATVQRRIRSNSKRLVIRTNDAAVWRWPMQWLSVQKK